MGALSLKNERKDKWKSLCLILDILGWYWETHVTFPPNLNNIITPKPWELESWNFERIFSPHHVSHVTCQESGVNLLRHFSAWVWTFSKDRGGGWLKFKPMRIVAQILFSAGVAKGADRIFFAPLPPLVSCRRS